MDTIEEKPYEIDTQSPTTLTNLELTLETIEKEKLHILCNEFSNFIATLTNRPFIYKKLKTEEAAIKTRKSPCGNGTNTWIGFKLRVFKRYYNIQAYDSEIEKIAEFLKNSQVQITLKLGGTN